MNKKTIDQIKNNIRYYGNLKKQMEISETKSKAVYFRRHILERQTMANYHNELDRISGELSRPILQGETREGLVAKRQYLKTIGAQATAGIN